jgi:arsenate reductase
MRHILFLCTGNSARSIMAEAYLNHAARDRWRAWSAGSNPTGAPNPLALETLERNDVPVSAGATAPSSKSWNEFAADNAPLMDLVVTVCDNAAAETCPVWPSEKGNAPKRLHWSFPDPAAATGSAREKRAAFEMVFAAIKARIDRLIAEGHAS